MSEAAIVVILGICVYRVALTVMFYPVRFWDLTKW
jgi:hypothetical protein